MAEAILIGSLIFISIWILGSILINRIVQKRINEPKLKEIYRM